ncbi:radical SAM protein [Nocardiopsis sp. NPDC050513]|uniref:radical SAM protein n=1 Tax=Nocardiopsis sp. NPDC050513 TaxID=3364338 RepID=UPI0037B5C106
MTDPQKTSHDPISKEIVWKEDDSYSPLQQRGGIQEPQSGHFPPARERVPQEADPFTPAHLDEREVLRVTYQGDDRCQLQCPGCFTGDRLVASLTEVLERGGRKVVPHGEFTGQIEGLGEGLQDFFLIGAEPTMDPAGSAAKLRYAKDRGLPHMSITNGAVRRDRLEATFGEALETDLFYKLNVSLDSMDKEVNNRLRGRAFAFDRTLETIWHLVERGAPLKVQMTVWPLNYATILDSVRQLFDKGVRSFAFHSGSVEGVDSPEQHGLGIVDPLAWRVLAEELLRFKDQHREELQHFNIPFLYFTEEELRTRVIGDDATTASYLDHVDAMEAGRPSTKPVHVCPALGAPQVYVFGNDGPEGNGVVSLCNIHNPGDDVAYADYQPGERRWKIVQDPDRNQMEHMLRSPHLCPATPFALRWESDRFPTQAGALFAACRYVGSNQMPVDRDQFGPEVYYEAVGYYALVREALDTYPNPGEDGDGEWPIQRVERLAMGASGFAERTRRLREDLSRS